jgi:hypothetical protein
VTIWLRIVDEMLRMLQKGSPITTAPFSLAAQRHQAAWVRDCDIGILLVRCTSYP